MHLHMTFLDSENKGKTRKRRKKMRHCLIPPTPASPNRILTAGKVNQGGNGLEFCVSFSREPLWSQVSMGSTGLTVISVLEKDREILL